MPSVAATASSSSLEAIADLFVGDDAPSLRSDLEEHPFLVPLLIEVHKTVPRYFPDAARVRLQLLSDPDEGDHVDLFAIIQTSLPEDQALELLDRFDEDWWLKVAARGRGLLTVDVETVS